MPHAARAVLDQLRASHDGDPWYGSPRSALLRGITAGQAAAHPILGAHSIWELVLHLTAWTREVAYRLDGAEPGPPAGGDWPAVGAPTAPRWAAARRALGRAHAELVARAERLGTKELRAPVGRTRDRALGTGVDRATLLIGLAQHDAYHLGQVALLRRALGK